MFGDGDGGDTGAEEGKGGEGGSIHPSIHPSKSALIKTAPFIPPRIKSDK